MFLAVLDLGNHVSGFKAESGAVEDAKPSRDVVVCIVIRVDPVPTMRLNHPVAVFALFREENDIEASIGSCGIAARLEVGFVPAAVGSNVAVFECKKIV